MLPTTALRSYRVNSDVVKGWIWNAACDVRTCVACWALHGSEHTFDDDTQDHPNGRCARSPWVKTWAELGFEGMDERPPMKSGEERFAKLTPEEQDKILGKAGGAAYRGGAKNQQGQPLTLKDFSTTKTSPEWGTHVQRKSLKGALGEEGAQRWYVRVAKREEARKELVQRLESSDLDAVVAGAREVQKMGDLQRHYIKHGALLKAHSAAEYEARLLAHLRKDTLEIHAKRDSRQRDILYLIDRVTDEFAEYNMSTGRINSYYLGDRDGFVRSAGAIRLRRTEQGWEID